MATTLSSFWWFLFKHSSIRQKVLLAVASLSLHPSVCKYGEKGKGGNFSNLFTPVQIEGSQEQKPQT